MTNPGPPRKLESMVGQLIPPACREHVLGDLAERYRNDRQYLGEGLRLIPMLLSSCIRRAADPQTLLIEICVTYFSFVAVGWQFGGASFLFEDSGFLRLAVSAITTIGVVLVFDVYSSGVSARGLPDRVIGAARAGIANLLCQLLLALIQGLHRLTAVFILGGLGSAFTISLLRLLIEPGAFGRFQKLLYGPEVDPVRMSPDEFRAAARRIYARMRKARNALLLLWLPATVWAWEVWRAHSLLFGVGSAVSSGGLVYGAYRIQKALVCGGQLEAESSLEDCLEFCSRNLEARRNLLRHVWSLVLGPQLTGTLIAMISDPGTQGFGHRLPWLAGAAIFYSAVGWFARGRLPSFERQLDALTRGRYRT